VLSVPGVVSTWHWSGAYSAPMVPQPHRPAEPVLHRMRPVRVVVTGGAGFIGSHVVDALVARGDEVTVVDSLATGKRENVSRDATLHEHDVREPLDDLFADVTPEAVFHLAAQADVRVSVEKPAYDAEVNVVGTLNVLEAARAHDAQVIFASTGGAIYGECERPARESDPREPISQYGTAKLAGEEYLQTYNRLYGSTHVSLRYGNVYGPRQDPHGEAGVVAIFLGALARSEQPRIFGDGLQTRDYVYVGDVARATIAALGQEGGVFNVGTGRELSVNELYDLCRQAAGSDAEAVQAPARLGELQRSVLSPDLAAEQLGFLAMVGLEDGLAATWDWVRSAREE
jgi:UDP-glucose 4-epimerase